jgi:hypothetical protein
VGVRWGREVWGGRRGPSGGGDSKSSAALCPPPQPRQLRRASALNLQPIAVSLQAAPSNPSRTRRQASTMPLFPLERIRYPTEEGQDTIYGLRLTLGEKGDFVAELGKIGDDTLRDNLLGSYVGLADNCECTTSLELPRLMKCDIYSLLLQGHDVGRDSHLGCDVLCCSFDTALGSSGRKLTSLSFRPI